MDVSASLVYIYQGPTFCKEYVFLPIIIGDTIDKYEYNCIKKKAVTQYLGKTVMYISETDYPNKFRFTVSKTYLYLFHPHIYSIDQSL